MTAPVWITPEGDLGVYQQSATQDINLEAIGTGITYSLISGELPRGLTINQTNGNIYGTPFYIGNNVVYEFVVRAKNSSGSSDRTFSLTIAGPVDPVWDTPEGYLQVGPNLEPYCLNKNRVDYRLQATVVGLPEGQSLRFYIAENDGQLPPGLKLNQDTGIINGYVNDQLAIDYLASKTGGYDNEYYDVYPYDHALIINNVVGGRLVSITKIYQFWVTVTDGISVTRRKFRIRVEDPNTFRTDTTQITDDTTNYLANIGYLIPPIWLGADSSILPNPSNLGTLRANNNQVINLNAYDPYPFVGPVNFDWDIIKVNPEIRFISNSEVNEIGLPVSNLVNQTYIIVRQTVGVPFVGMSLQLNTYVTNSSERIYRINKVEQYGSNGYKLSLGLVTKYKGELLTSNDFPLTNTPGDMYKVLSNNRYYVCTDIPNTFTDVGANAVGFIDYKLENTIPDGTTLFVGSLSTKPQGLELDPEQGLIYGRLPYQPAYSLNYRFTVRITKTDQETGETVSNNHIFNLTLKGDIETTINFISDTILGSIRPGHVSELAVKAEHTAQNLDITYNLTGGRLPPGLTLTPTGNITGKIPVGIQLNFDAQLYGYNKTTFDGGQLTFDRSYTFNITARDSYLLSAVSKDFTIFIQENTLTPYTSIYVKPLLSREQRLYFRSLVEDFTVFDPSLLYRSDDPYFGVQNQVKMTIEYGLQKIDLDKYVPALSEYFKRRRYYFGDVKSAIAVDSNGNHLYDVVYIDIVDDQMIGNKISVARSFTQIVNGETVTYYPDSVLNEQYALRSIEISNGTPIGVDDDYRPRFMQTLQEDTGVPLGFVKACVLCYTKPNESGKIISSIKRSGFDFKLIDFDVDRIAIENTLDFEGTKYLVFGSDSTDAGFYIATEDDEIILTEDGQELSL